MAMTKHKNLWTAATAAFATKFGTLRPGELAQYDTAASPGYVERWTNAAQTGDIDVIGTDQFDNCVLHGAKHRGMRMGIKFNIAANAGQATQRLFVADQPYEIQGILLQYNTTDGAANTANITKEYAGQAPGAGVAVMTGTFNLNSTANVVQSATIPGRSAAGVFGVNEPAISLNTGEMLSLNIASAVTNLAGLTVTLFLIPKNTISPAVYQMNANASLATQVFFLANRPVTVSGITAVWSAAATDAGAVTIDVTKDTSTNAPGAGVSLLTAAQSVKGVANTPVSIPLTATTSRLTLAAGDRIAIKYTGTLTALAGMVVVVSFAQGDVLGSTNSIAGMAQQTFALAANASLGTAQDFFIADRDYEVYDVSVVWSAAGGAASRVTVTVDGSTVADGAGTSVLTDNSNAGFDTTATANTVVVGTLASVKRTIFLPSGSRLGVVFAGTKGSLAGLAIAVSMVPR